MDGRIAGLVFLGICLVLAVLLLMQAITPVVGGGAFAVTLVLLGSTSRGFRKRS